MTAPNDSKQATTNGLIEADLPVSSSDVPASQVLEAARYYFNLTDGDSMIRDNEGVTASSLQAAVVAAMEAVEELRVQDPLSSDEWQGWRLEIVDATGQAVQVVPLDALSAH